MTTASLEAPLSSFTLPDPWHSSVYSKIHGILGMERTRLALAQVFDGIQSYSAGIDMGDIDSLDLPLTWKVTEEAREDANRWLAPFAHDCGPLMIKHVLAKEAQAVVCSNEPDSYKIGAVVLCYIKPAIRNCLEKYFQHCAGSGRHLSDGSFQKWWRGEIPPVEAIQDWGEEYIFGGVLSHHEDKDKLRVQRIQLKPFTVSNKDIWHTDRLPLCNATFSHQRRPRFEDDPVAIGLMEGIE